MPRRKYGKRKRRRTTKKIVRYNKRNALYNSFPMGMSLKRKLRYFERNISLDPGVGGIIACYTYSLNGLYDPNITGAGHQPMGFDQIMLMYNNFTVIGAKARITFRTTDSSTGVDVGCHISTTSTAPNNLDELIENGRCKWKLLGYQGGNGPTIAHMNAKASIKKYFQMKNIMDEDDLKGTVLTNPNKQLYLHIFARQPNNVDSQPVYAQVLLEYVSIFTRPIMLNQS